MSFQVSVVAFNPIWTIFRPCLIHYHLKYLAATSNLHKCCEHPIHQFKKLLVESDSEPRSLAKTPSKHTLAALASAHQWKGVKVPVGPEEKYQVSSGGFDSFGEPIPRSLITNRSQFQTPIQFLAASIVPEQFMALKSPRNKWLNPHVPNSNPPIL